MTSRTTITSTETPTMTSTNTVATTSTNRRCSDSGVPTRRRRLRRRPAATTAFSATAAFMSLLVAAAAQEGSYDTNAARLERGEGVLGGVDSDTIAMKEGDDAQREQRQQRLRHRRRRTHEGDDNVNDENDEVNRGRQSPTDLNERRQPRAGIARDLDWNPIGSNLDTSVSGQWDPATNTYDSAVYQSATAGMTWDPATNTFKNGNTVNWNGNGNYDHGACAGCDTQTTTANTWTGQRVDLPKSSNPSDHYFCATSITTLMFPHTMSYAEWKADTCVAPKTNPCPNGDPVNECPYGQLCFFTTDCDRRDLPTEAPVPHPTIAPLMDGDERLHFFCGRTWGDASEKCNQWCPGGSNDDCPSGHSCFSDTMCDAKEMPTASPTRPQPTASPVLSYTLSPTKSPVIPPMPPSPSNHNFCGAGWEQSAKECSVETNCPSGSHSECPFDQTCWTNIPCDVRNFVPVSEGGLMIPVGMSKEEAMLLDPSSMTDKEVALMMNLTYPSDEPRDHYFCGRGWDDAIASCSIPCPDGTPSACDHGQLCYFSTPCDARIREDYGKTGAPASEPTASPITYDDPMNNMFCGDNWAHANDCDANTQWCPNGRNTDCPEGQSCFSQTFCNIQDRPPTHAPSRSPVAYDDPANFMFCGQGYTDAAAACSLKTHCPGGTNAECLFGASCWAKVSCNAVDMLPPSPPPTSRPTTNPTYDPRWAPTRTPTQVPTVEPTGRPTGSPLEEGDDRHSFYCGSSWSDANQHCKQKCPHMVGCPAGESCFAHTSCPTQPLDQEPERTEEEEEQVDSSSAPNNEEDREVDADEPPRIETRPPTRGPTPSPTRIPTRGPTLRPTLPPTPPVIEASSPSTNNDLIMPDVAELMLPPPPPRNSRQIEDLLETMRTSLEETIFTYETRGGSFVPSSIYTFEDFRDGLRYLYLHGVDGHYFYLGDTNGSSDGVEYGMANLALFLAKMMTGAMRYERCDAHALSCGLFVLDDLLDGRTMRCPASEEDGMECPSSSPAGGGCACNLGRLNHFIGRGAALDGQSSDAGYPVVDFCAAPQESLCTGYGPPELKWVAAMYNWASFVQQHDGNRYLTGLHNFVDGGMSDMSFVDDVSEISISDEAHTASGGSDLFRRNFFKVMMVLLDGRARLGEQPPPPPPPPTPPPTPRPSSYRPPPPPPTRNPTTPPTPPSNKGVFQSGLTQTEICSRLCLEAMPSVSEECRMDGNLPGCLFVGLYEFCEGDGECGTDDELNNCGEYDVYRRVDCTAATTTTSMANAVAAPPDNIATLGEQGRAIPNDENQVVGRPGVDFPSNTVEDQHQWQPPAAAGAGWSQNTDDQHEQDDWYAPYTNYRDQSGGKMKLPTARVFIACVVLSLQLVFVE